MNATTPRPNVFLDTSALFAGIWSDEGGARVLLRMGEAGAIVLLVSPQVLAELERTLSRKAPDALPLAALIVDRTGAQVVPQADASHLPLASGLVSHPGDAAVLAAAWQASADFFVTLDRKHFLENPKLAQAVPFHVGTPGDALAWIRGRFRTRQDQA